MISEYLDMGPLDEYLNANKQVVQQVDLVEAAASLAMALWQMVTVFPAVYFFFYKFFSSGGSGHFTWLNSVPENISRWP